MRMVGGAHRGLNLWLWQRASAVVMALYLPLIVILALAAGPLDYAAWRGLFTPLWMKVASFLFAASLLLHAWIGVREVLIDYVHPMALRLSLLFLFAVLYLGCLVWAGHILWTLA